MSQGRGKIFVANTTDQIDVDVNDMTVSKRLS